MNDTRRRYSGLKLRAFAIALLVAQALLFTVPVIRTSHAQTIGTVCIVPSGWTACPVEPATLVATVGTLMNVSVAIQNSDSFDSYNIFVKPNYTEISPIGLQSGLVSAACVNGGAVAGLPSACGSGDGTGIVHAVYSGMVLSAPVTRLLFTITYRVVSGASADMIGYLQGCSPSSVAGTTDCLRVSNAGTTVPEEARFSPFSTNGQPPAGVVCIAPTTATSCLAPSSFSGSAGSLLKVAVDINITKPINGFDVSVKTDSSVLYPQSIDYNNSVIPSKGNGVWADECINGQLVLGPRCTSWDGPGIAHLAAVGPLAWLSNRTVTGQLFTVTYVVLANTNSTVGFQTGCPSSSVPNTGICVTLADGTTTPVPVTIIDPAFTAGGASGKVSLDKTLDFKDLRVHSTGNLTLFFAPQIATITGTVSVTLSNGTSGSILLAKVFTVNFTIPFGSRARFVIVLPTTSALLAENCMLDQSAATTANCFVSKDPDIAGNGVVSIVDAGIVFAQFGKTSTDPLFNPKADLDTDDKITLIDAGIEAALYGATVFN